MSEVQQSTQSQASASGEPYSVEGEMNQKLEPSKGADRLLTSTGTMTPDPTRTDADKQIIDPAPGEPAQQSEPAQGDILTSVKTETELPEWVKDLPEEFQSNPNVTKYKTLDELVKGHVNAVSLLGKKQISMGLDSPDEYKFELDGSLLDPDDEQGLKVLAHKFGLSNENATLMAQALNSRLHALADQEQADEQTQIQDSVNELKTRWGKDVDTNLSMWNHFLEQQPLLKEVVLENNLGNDWKTIAAVYEIARQFEDGSNAAPRPTYSVQSIDEQIAAMRQTPQFREEGHPQHAEAMRQYEALYKKKAEMLG